MGEVLRLLLVEDNVIAAEGMQLVLEDSGFSVALLHEGREVISRILAWSPDALILDVSLPDADGAELAAQIRERCPELPIILATGHESFNGMEALLQNELTSMLRKPYELRALISEIRTLVARVDR